jgi:sulfur-carrier protein
VKVTVRLYATLRELVPDRGATVELEVPDGATVADVIADLGLPPDLVRKVFVAGVAQDTGYVLRTGDELGMFPPIAGGAV